MRQRGSGQVAQYGLAFTHALKALGRDLANRRHEPEVRFLSHVLSGAPTCLHLGASDGRHSFSILKAAPGARIYAFEPASFDIQALRIGLRMRGLTGRIIPVQAAVGEAAAEAVAALYRGLGYRFFAVVGDEVEERQTLEPAGAHGDFFLIHPARSLPDGPFREAIGRPGSALEQLHASG